MNSTAEALTELFEKVPRRHSAENVKEITAIISEYESILIKIESINAYYEKQTAVIFAELENVRTGIKKSTDSKASKKNKDDYFQEASGNLKQNMETLIGLYGDGSKTG